MSNCRGTMYSTIVEDEQLQSNYSVQLWKMSNCRETMYSAIVEDEQLQSNYSVQLWKMSNCSAMCSAVCSNSNFSIPTSRNVKHWGSLGCCCNLKLLNNYL